MTTPKRRKPDNVVDNPMGKAYGTNVGAPAITLPDVDGYKKGIAAEASHRFHTRYRELEQEYITLMEEAEYNDRLINASIAFKPTIGTVYYLYNGGSDFISMLSPDDWGKSYMQNKTFVGAFRIMSDNVWKQVPYPPEPDKTIDSFIEKD